jgi:hypothetical protein
MFYVYSPDGGKWRFRFDLCGTGTAATWGIGTDGDTKVTKWSFLLNLLQSKMRFVEHYSTFFPLIVLQ